MREAALYSPPPCPVEADPAHRADKWFRFSALNDAPVKKLSAGHDPKSANPLLGPML
jgi:hypothetical protein